MIISGKNKNTNIFFEGDSLMAHNADSSAIRGQYIPNKAYTTIIASKSRCAMFSLAAEGRRMAYIEAGTVTDIMDYPIKENDIIFLWAGTNDMAADATSPQDTWASMVSYISRMTALGIKLVVGTATARNYVTDPADIMTSIGTFNGLIRANAATYGYTICDLGADPLFDTEADTANGTYYTADAVHMTQAGKDVCAGLISTAILNRL